MKNDYNRGSSCASNMKSDYNKGSSCASNMKSGLILRIVNGPFAAFACLHLF